MPFERDQEHREHQILRMDAHEHQYRQTANPLKNSQAMIVHLRATMLLYSSSNPKQETNQRSRSFRCKHYRCNLPNYNLSFAFPVCSTSFAEPNPNDGIHLDNKGVESLEKLPAHPLPIATAAATDENLVGPQPLYSAHPDDQEGSIRHLTTAQLFVKDAFLVFRALCKLNMEPLLSER
jgi:hypothetical protein